MRDWWIEQSLILSERKADFYSGARKILTNVTLSMHGADATKTLTMADCGFTSAKMKMLTKNYFLPPSIAAAKELWNERVKKDKYGSVGISCYGHYVKGDVGGHTPRGSKFGPCIQAVTLTYNKRATTVDIFYRTTEFFKKFPADLVFLRDVLLPEFDFKRAPIKQLNFHFANITCHPMYFITLVPHIERPLSELEKLRTRDPFFYKWVVKWSARYICPEHSNGIQKFAQALRVGVMAKKNIDPEMMKHLQRYVRLHYPNLKEEEDEDD